MDPIVIPCLAKGREILTGIAVEKKFIEDDLVNRLRHRFVGWKNTLGRNLLQSFTAEQRVNEPLRQSVRIGHAALLGWT